jgi:hypothetical protein
MLKTALRAVFAYSGRGPKPGKQRVSMRSANAGGCLHAIGVRGLSDDFRQLVRDAYQPDFLSPSYAISWDTTAEVAARVDPARRNMLMKSEPIGAPIRL